VNIRDNVVRGMGIYDSVHEDIIGSPDSEIDRDEDLE